MWEELGAERPTGDLDLREYPVHGADGPLGEVLPQGVIQFVTKHGLDEAVDGVGPGLGVSARGSGGPAG